MAYNPDFSRNSKGKFNPELGFVSIKGGTDAYFLEDELNEIQWMQNEARAEIIRKLTNSGCMQAKQFGENFENGGLKELLHNNLNSFLLYGFDAILNGYLAYIDRNDLDGNLITLPDPPTTGSRSDFVYLEFWFNELKYNDDIKKYGGVNNPNVNYEIMGYQMGYERLGVETSRRVQLQWNIRVIPDVNPDDYPLGFVSEYNISNPNINPMCNTQILQTDFIFRNHNNDHNLFITGNGTSTDINILKTIDGFCYAIPLFFIKRLNNSGYNEISNPNGAINYIDNNSISDRPDGKFSNLIYQDDVIDIRPLAIMGRIQLDNIYASKTEFNQLLTFVNNINQRLTIIESQLESLGIDLSFSNLMYYGTNMEFNDVALTGGEIQIDNTINSFGTLINSAYPGYNNYGIMYTVNTQLSSSIGDVWLEKADNAAILKNTGYDNININTIVLENNNDIVTVGSETFNSMDGIEISRQLLETDFLFITPTSNVYGTIGEIYYETSANGFIVYNTGQANTTFDYIIIDTTQLRNVILTDFRYEGITTITGIYGTNFKVFIGPSNVPVNQGSIGDVTITKSLNTLTIYNTGSNNDGSVSAKCLIFKETTIE